MLFRSARCNQTSVEKWLGIQREDTFSGGDLIPVYSEYMQKKILNPQKADSLKELLLLHNHDDIAMMLNVCSLLLYSDLFDPEKYTDLLVCKRHSDRGLPIPTTFSDPKNNQNNSNLQKTGYQLEQTDTTVTLTFLLLLLLLRILLDRKSTRLNSSHRSQSRMPSSA